MPSDFKNFKNLNVFGLNLLMFHIICQFKLSDIVFRCIAKCICTEKLILSRTDFDNIIISDLNMNNSKNTLKEIDVFNSKNVDYT